MNKTAQGFKRLFETSRTRLSYIVQGAILEFTEAIVSRMAALKFSRTQLAARLGCNPSYITKVLRGGTNFTLESMAGIALALDSELAVTLIPKSSPEKWCDILTKGAEMREEGISSVSWPIPRAKMDEFSASSTTEDSDKDELAIAA